MVCLLKHHLTLRIFILRLAKLSPHYNNSNNNNMISNLSIDEWELTKVARYLVKHNPDVHKTVERTKQTIRNMAELVKPGEYMDTTGFVIFRCYNNLCKVAIGSCMLPGSGM